VTNFDETIFEKIICTALKVPRPDSSLRMGHTPSWDSVAHLDIVFQLEKSFGVAFDLDAIADYDTVEKLRTTLKGLLGL
jgi:acyl carrier protein